MPAGTTLNVASKYIVYPCVTWRCYNCLLSCLLAVSNLNGSPHSYRCYCIFWSCVFRPTFWSRIFRSRIFHAESRQSDICCFWAMALSPYIVISKLACFFILASDLFSCNKWKMRWDEIMGSDQSAPLTSTTIFRIVQILLAGRD